MRTDTDDDTEDDATVSPDVMRESVKRNQDSFPAEKQLGTPRKNGSIPPRCGEKRTARGIAMVVHTSSSSSSSSDAGVIRRRGGRMTNNSLSSLTTTSQYQSLTAATNDAAHANAAADDDDENEGDDDPPFRKFGHTHIGKRVRYYFYPPPSSSCTFTTSSSSATTTTVHIDGTITGYLSPHDVDSTNAPAFICTRTHRPASLFHVEFDADNIYYRYKDLEGFELDECCTWLPSHDERTSSSSSSSAATTDDDNAGGKEGGGTSWVCHNPNCKRTNQRTKKRCSDCRSWKDGKKPNSRNTSGSTIVLIDFSSTELASKYRIVADTFDSSLLVQGQLVAFGATRDKTATRPWVVGNISSLYVNKVHWARVKEYSNREYVFAASEKARDTYGKEWYFVAGYGEEGGVVPPPRLHSSSLFLTEASWVCHNPNCKRTNQISKKRCSDCSSWKDGKGPKSRNTSGSTITTTKKKKQKKGASIGRKESTAIAVDKEEVHNVNNVNNAIDDHVDDHQGRIVLSLFDEQYKRIMYTHFAMINNSTATPTASTTTTTTMTTDEENEEEARIGRLALAALKMECGRDGQLFIFNGRGRLGKISKLEVVDDNVALTSEYYKVLFSNNETISSFIFSNVI